MYRMALRSLRVPRRPVVNVAPNRSRPSFAGDQPTNKSLLFYRLADFQCKNSITMKLVFMTTKSAIFLREIYYR